MTKNNITFRKLVILLLSGFLVLTSCKTLPSPASEDDTMLIIATGIEKKGTSDWFGKYRIHITNNKTEEVVKTHIMPISSQYTIIKGLPPGKYYISRDEFIYNSNRSPGTHRDRSYYFELIPNHITILNRKFIYTYLSDSGMNRKWESFPAGSKLKLLESFEEYKNFDLWDSD